MDNVLSPSHPRTVCVFFQSSHLLIGHFYLDSPVTFWINCGIIPDKDSKGFFEPLYRAGKTENQFRHLFFFLSFTKSAQTVLRGEKFFVFSSQSFQIRPEW